MPVIQLAKISREFVREHRKWMFLFGDNEARMGFGGQAKEMRGEPNSRGVRTKKYPNMEEYAFWSDDDFIKCRDMIIEDLIPANLNLFYGHTVVIPYGIGEGHAELYKRAPRVFRFLQNNLNAMINHGKKIS